MKRMLLLVLAFSLLLITPASASMVSINMIATGKLLDAFGLPDGGAVVLTLNSNERANYLEVTRSTESGETIGSQAFLSEPMENLTDIFVSVCKTRVQVFANFANPDDPATATVYQYVFNLDESTGVCEWRAHNLFIPIMVH